MARPEGLGPDPDRGLTATEKLLQALDMMATGLRWKRAALARQHPAASPHELDALYQQWLLEDD